jgi:acetoin utilization deacetylase AcuC-like enzyme
LPSTNKEVPGQASVVGDGAGAGYSVNLGWDCLSSGGPGPGNAEYADAFDRLLMPIAEQFRPELVIVSAGFDSALGDPEGECRCTPDGYAWMTSRLMGLADGKVVVALEGGYNVPSVKYCLGACVGALLGAAPPDKASFGRPSQEAVQAVNETRDSHKAYWQCLN